MSRDLVGVLLSGAYVALVLGVAEVARRRGLPRRETRKIVHVGIGTWIVPSFLLFSSPWWPAALGLGFVALNSLSMRFGWIRSMEGEERNVGTVLYPLSVAILLVATWPETWRAVGAAGVLVMAYGDAAASIVGRRFGRRVYRVAGHPRTLEGSAAMVGVAWVAIVVAFLLLGPAPTSGLLAAAAVAAVAAAVLEGISLWGTDNILVPLGTAGCLALLRGPLW